MRPTPLPVPSPIVRPRGSRARCRRSGTGRRRRSRSRARSDRARSPASAGSRPRLEYAIPVSTTATLTPAPPGRPTSSRCCHASGALTPVSARKFHCRRCQPESVVAAPGVRRHPARDVGDVVGRRAQDARLALQAADGRGHALAAASLTHLAARHRTGARGGRDAVAHDDLARLVALAGLDRRRARRRARWRGPRPARPRAARRRAPTRQEGRRAVGSAKGALGAGRWMGGVWPAGPTT